MAIQSQECRTLWKITEWRDGAIWKTKQIGTICIEIDPYRTTEEENAIAKANGGDMLGSMPTTASYDACYRTVKV